MTEAAECEFECGRREEEQLRVRRARVRPHRPRRQRLRAPAVSSRRRDEVRLQLKYARPLPEHAEERAAVLVQPSPGLALGVRRVRARYRERRAEHVLAAPAAKATRVQNYAPLQRRAPEPHPERGDHEKVRFRPRCRQGGPEAADRRRGECVLKIGR